MECHWMDGYLDHAEGLFLSLRIAKFIVSLIVMSSFYRSALIIISSLSSIDKYMIFYECLSAKLLLHVNNNIIIKVQVAIYHHRLHGFTSFSRVSKIWISMKSFWSLWNLRDCFPEIKMVIISKVCVTTIFKNLPFWDGQQEKVWK